MLEDHLRPHSIELNLLPLFTRGDAANFAGGNPVRRAAILLRARRRLRAQAASVDADVAFVQRHADMLPTVALERAISSGRRLVLDVDDAIWLEGRIAGGHPLARLKRGESRVRWLAERAGRVLAGNEILAERLGRWSPRVTVVPSLVDVHAAAVRRHEDSEGVTLGWIGSGTTARYLAGATESLERFAEVVAPRPVTLLAVGGSAPRPRGVHVVEKAWNEQTEREALMTMDIGLMPLPDTPWTRGKCAYKALQYMAAGVPVVADDVGVTGRVVGSGGVVAEGRDEWVDALSMLAGDRDARARLGAAGREHVTENYSVRRWAPVIAGALKGD